MYRISVVQPSTSSSRHQPPAAFFIIIMITINATTCFVPLFLNSAPLGLRSKD